MPQREEPTQGAWYKLDKRGIPRRPAAGEQLPALCMPAPILHNTKRALAAKPIGTGELKVRDVVGHDLDLGPRRGQRCGRSQTAVFSLDRYEPYCPKRNLVVAKIAVSIGPPNASRFCCGAS